MPARKPKQRTTIRILFIGNSFTNRNDLPHMLECLAAAAKSPRTLHTDRIIANGRALKTHWERGEALEAVKSAKWDYVVLQEQSTLPLKNPVRMEEYVRRFDDEIRGVGAKTTLFMTWARRHEWERQAQLSDTYNRIGKAIGAIVVPAGDAWRCVLTRHPDLVLHDRDNSHPNLAGSYLTACTFVSTLFNQNPHGLETSDSAGLARIGTDTLEALQDAAWRVSENSR